MLDKMKSQNRTEMIYDEDVLIPNTIESSWNR